MLVIIQLKKTENNTKIIEIEKKTTDDNHDKYITTLHFNKPTAETFFARLAQTRLVRKTDYYNNLIKLN